MLADEELLEWINSFARENEILLSIDCEVSFIIIAHNEQRQFACFFIIKSSIFARPEILPAFLTTRVLV